MRVHVSSLYACAARVRRTAMNLELDPQTQRLLERFGFDAASFLELRRRLLSGEFGPEANRVRGQLEAPEPADVRVPPLPGTPAFAELTRLGQQALAAGEVGCVVLAGGMATRFGGVVKAAVDALPGRSFLSLKLADFRSVAARYGARVPVYVMSSFATHAELVHLVAAEQSEGAPIELFCQFVSLRVTPDGELFIGADGRPSPYAPGHGDLPRALRQSGALRRFAERGGRLLTLSNVDNLGATLDPAVIGAHLAANVELSVEVGRRTPGERGGIPARLDGKLQIIEDFRLPEGFDMASVPYFNTNTFVVNAPALDRDFDLNWYVVHKRVDGREVVQFEHLVGELSAFLSCAAIEIARDGLDGRFQPVKDPDELALRQPEIEQILRARGVL